MLWDRLHEIRLLGISDPDVVIKFRPDELRRRLHLVQKERSISPNSFSNPSLLKPRLGPAGLPADGGEITTSIIHFPIIAGVL
jgi:hypothetical protein